MQSLNVDLANVYTPDGRYLTTLAWGDRLEVTGTTSKGLEVTVTRYLRQPDGSVKPSEVEGLIKKPTAASGLTLSDLVVDEADSRILKVDFVDVQQGDGSVIETPSGRVILVDGGDNQLFARYLATRYPATSNEAPKEVECIVVTHGDADHFAGLTEIHDSETNSTEYKRLFLRPKRVYHNGLVKRPDKVRESDRLGPTTTVDGETIITGLETDLLGVDDAKMNTPFRGWKRALRAFSERGAIEFRRLSKGDDAAFDFLRDEDVDVEVLGPILTTGGGVEGLLFLGEPSKGPRIGHEAMSLGTGEFGGKSASHTINGHSVVLKLTYGGFRFLFSGDLNDQAERILTREHKARKVSVRAEVFKVPHHGSHEFSGAFMEAVAPVVSVVSSGDESARKEYIHPRATLIGALGRFSRPGLDEPLIFVTEMVAFFEVEGWVRPERHKEDDEGDVVIEDGTAVLLPRRKPPFFAFSRSAFGIVKVRTDGDRLLVWTNSGQTNLKEVYAYRVGSGHVVLPDSVRLAR